jgi:hypothetical protein
MEVVQTMHDGGFSATAAVAFYDEIVQLWQEFGKISISHCNRSCNSVAHELAKQALVQKSSQVWVDDLPSSILDDLPSSILHLLVNDVATYMNQ